MHVSLAFCEFGRQFGNLVPHPLNFFIFLGKSFDRPVGDEIRVHSGISGRRCLVLAARCVRLEATVHRLESALEVLDLLVPHLQRDFHICDLRTLVGRNSLAARDVLSYLLFVLCDLFHQVCPLSGPFLTLLLGRFGLQRKMVSAVGRKTGCFRTHIFVAILCRRPKGIDLGLQLEDLFLLQDKPLYYSREVLEQQGHVQIGDNDQRWIRSNNGKESA